MATELTGQLERVTYFNEENGYTVAKLKVYGRRDLVTIVGNLMSPTPGEIIEINGQWANHPKFGEQFKVETYKTKVPATIYGIRKYLGSGLIKGIGPVMAKRIVNKFKEDTLDIIDNRPEALDQVQGIGKKRVGMIKEAWKAQKEIRNVMLFLQSHGVSSGYATKIFKQYGEASIAVVKENPFRLAMDIFGIGFITADNIAQKLGFEKDSEVRVQAGILYVLNKLSDEGHVYYPHEPLIEKAIEILEVAREDVSKGIQAMKKENRIKIEDIDGPPCENNEGQKAVFLEKFHFCEINIAARLKQLVYSPKSIRKIDEEKALEWVQERLSINLAEKQSKAVKSALASKVMVITGGPGTGKTTIINAILQIYLKLTRQVVLAAPTGRAAKRMGEATGLEAKTIHRLLEYSMALGGFQKNDENPLDTHLIIIDEASMIDTVLMHHLLKAVPVCATLILVGDVNQLPSVGAGNVLNDIISSGLVPVVTLKEIFRQAKESMIIVNAHLINKGIMPKIQTGHESDFYFIEQEEPEKALSIIIELARQRIPKRFNFNPLYDIQVITPMHKGCVGAGNLNLSLQKALNPKGMGITRGMSSFLVNDKVMQIKNNYDKEVFNGDIGIIKSINPEKQEVIINFDNKGFIYDYSELDEIVLAYAISVHKSQGSEYPAVIMPVMTQHYVLLQRNLIYTGATRGRKLVVMVGTRKALAMGIKNNKTRKRFTGLASRLRKWV